MTMKISKQELKKVIAESMNEIFGYSGQDFERMGLKNPANDYTVNYQEAKETCEKFLPNLQQFCNYIGGVEEDVENGVEEKRGLYSTMDLHSMWDEDGEEERYAAEDLREMYYALNKAISTIEEFIEFCEYKNS